MTMQTAKLSADWQQSGMLTSQSTKIKCGCSVSFSSTLFYPQEQWKNTPGIRRISVLNLTHIWQKTAKSSGIYVMYWRLSALKMKAAATGLKQIENFTIATVKQIQYFLE